MHKSLVSLGIRWLKQRCSIVFYEFTTAANESPDIIGWGSGFSILIECKVTRSDFLQDSKKLVRRYPHLGMGQQRYYLCPPEVITIEDLPESWGLLWAYKKRIFFKKGAFFHPEWNSLDEIKFLTSMLRRAQIRIGKLPLSEWLRFENMDVKASM